MSRWRLGLVLVLMGMIVSQVAAAEPDLSRGAGLVGGDFRISGAAATASDTAQAVAYNSTANQYLVVWRDDRDSGTRGNDIYGQLLAANGTRIGGDFRISGANATTDEHDPAVAYNSTSNQYLVVWKDGRDFATRGHEIYGRRVKTTGNLAGGDFRISGATATANESLPAVAYNSTDNQYLVVWEDSRDQGTRGSEIYGRRVKATGNLAGEDFRVCGSAATANEWDPKVAYNSTDNQYLVVWEDYRDYGTRGDDIYGRRVKAGGKLAGGDFRISGAAATDDELDPAVAYNSIGNQYLVAWDDYRDYVTRGDDIYARRVKATGNLAGEDFRVCGSAATTIDYQPAVAYNPTSNQYLVAWSDSRNFATRQWDIWGRRVKAGGKLAGGDFRISGASATTKEHDPGLAYNSTSNQFLVVWRDYRDFITRGWDIYGRRIAG